jgi:MFS family permease
MPRVPQSSRVRLAAPIDAVRAAAVEQLAAETSADDQLRVAAGGDGQPSTLTLRLRGDGRGTVVEATSAGDPHIPFFGWFFRPLFAIERRRRVNHAIGTLRAAVEGGPAPPPPKGVWGLPPVAFQPEQVTLLATASAAVAVVAFSNALFSQFAGPIGDTFHVSDARFGVLVAITRIGAVLALFATAIADRRGRRRSILAGVIGSSIACAVSAAAPNIGVLTTAQVFQRGFLITTAAVAGIAVIEEAPEGARAYAASMLALAGGFGFSFAVVLLPFGDLGQVGWRIPFAIGAATILLAPKIARRLSETTRYQALVARTDVARGRLRDIVDRGYGRRFLLLAIVGFLTNVFSAPSSFFMNKYLEDDRAFSSTGIAIFRAVTTAIPGLFGLLIGGRLAEARGRRPVAAIALAIATATQMVFFLMGGSLLWVMSAASVVASGAAGIALGTLDAELFPTEVRSTSNALLIVISVVGSAVGLVLAGVLADPLGGLGRAVALTGIASLAAALLFVPRLPESVAQLLEEISPTDAAPRAEYGPDA